MAGKRWIAIARFFPASPQLTCQVQPVSGQSDGQNINSLHSLDN